MKRPLLFIVFCLVTATSLADEHFIEDVSCRSTTDSVFAERMTMIGEQFFRLDGLHPTERETEALRFLYAYMTVADITDYPTAFFLENVRSSEQARTEMSWGATVPASLYRHFVLPVRVNNEALDSSRVVFYRELKSRVEGKSMYDAILEVNHWCHEKVTYEPSDARTSSPLATIRTAKGRCGEESTFTVAALRSVGIPARQVYTPRWAHTDDNHAWVEAWADGKWYFLGACEPEPVLNLGWFNAPASRAMLMHTRVFGDYDGPEEVVLRTSNFTEINLTDSYAATSSVRIVVSDKQGMPVEGAKVEFKIYNYAEFYTAVTKYTDADGSTSLGAGRGDMLVWASKDGCYAYGKASFGKDETLSLTLDNDSRIAIEGVLIDSLDIIPPKEQAVLPAVSDEQRRINDERFAHEDSIRLAYMSTFIDKETAAAIDAEGAEFIVKAKGNHAVIRAFLERHADRKERALALLASLSDKDLRDIQPDILEDNFSSESSELCPRVEDEMIILPYKHFLAQAFGPERAAMFRNDPSQLVEWVRDSIRINPDKRSLRIAQTPVGVMRSRFTDTRSRDIFFVSAARSLGIAARKEPLTGKVQYRKGDEWYDVEFETGTQQQTPTGTLVLSYAPTELLDDPSYYSHFSLSKIVDGTARLLTLDEGQVDMGGGMQWSGTFKGGVSLDVGTYILTTGSRLANGGVLAVNKRFTITEGDSLTVEMLIRQSDSEVSVIGSFDSESLFAREGRQVSILSRTGRGYYLVVLAGVGQEPTNHVLHDIEKKRDVIDEWGRPMLVLFEDEESAGKYRSEEFAALPANTIYGIDTDGRLAAQIRANMKLGEDARLPIVIVADTFNRVVFVSEGYTIGIGESLQRIIKGIQ